MEKTIQELRRIISFKDTTQAGDIVLNAIAEPKSVFYALITDISPDQAKRDWWQLTMHILGLPPQKVTWALREPQFSGREVFTMNGIEHFMQAVDFGPVGAPPVSKLPVRRKAVLRVVK